MARLRVILEQGEGVPFPPFDRYAMYQESQGKSLAELLESFAQLRRQNLADLQALNLSAEQLQSRGTHPDLGTVTLQQLLSAWAVHDLGHLHQVAKAMAYQYRHEVGPWNKLLTILPKE